MKVKKALLTAVAFIAILFAFYGNIIQLFVISPSKTISKDGCAGEPTEVNDLESVNYASSSEITEYDNFRVAYYNNLTKNFGDNNRGSCGYIALGMLLSYYDTYLNDNIIPEQYDKVSIAKSRNFIDNEISPGVMNDFISASNNKDYYNKLSALSEVSLHAKLVTIGVSKGYCDIENGNYRTWLESRKNVLETYFNDMVGYTKGNQYTLDYVDYETTYKTNSDKVKSFIISKIKEGFPVLISLANVDGSKNHACIAYDYNEDSGDIYCHFGLMGFGYEHKTIIDAGFSYYKTAMVIDFNLTHSHSNNYSDRTNNYCYCSDEICVYKHKRNLENTNTTYHTVSCACGSINTTENHKFNTYQKYNNNFHMVKCECGAQKQAVHKFVTYNVAGHEVTQCSLCGQYKYSQIIIPDLNSLSLEEYLLSLSGEAVTTCGE